MNANMKSKKQTGDPKYIKELMQPTPSGIAKLLSAWSGLSAETQIIILSKLDETHAPGYLTEKVRINALDSDNSYVRYLAAKNFYFSNECSDEERLIREKIENDSDPLVKYSLLEDSSGISAIFDDSLNDADTFFALPHEARLAKIRTINGHGEKVAALLEHAVDKQLKEGSVSEIELFEILTDYLVKPKFHEKYTDNRVTYDGFGEYLKGKDIESLWQLVPKLPEGISHVLIENLPEASGLKSEIPEDVINAMTDYQLQILLDRSDVGLEKLRKKLFWESDESRDKIISTAFNFNLTHDEFANILAKSPEEGVSILKDLGMLANELSLCFYDAIHDVLFASDVSTLGNDFEYAIFARDSFERRLNELEGWQKEKELTELRLYRLAEMTVPRNSKKKVYPPSGELEFLSEKIVPGDTWATFMGFSETWSSRSSRTKDLDKHLPRIAEIEDDLKQEDPEIDPAIKTNTELVKGINEKLSTLQEQLKSSHDQDNEDLLDGIDEVRRSATMLSSDAQKEQMRLQATLNRQKYLLYAVIVLVVWMLIMQY